VTKSVTASHNHPYGCQLPYSDYFGPTGRDYGRLLCAAIRLMLEYKLQMMAGISTDSPVMGHFLVQKIIFVN